MATQVFMLVEKRIYHVEVDVTHKTVEQAATDLAIDWFGADEFATHEGVTLDDVQYDTIETWDGEEAFTWDEVSDAVYAHASEAGRK